MKKTVRQVDAIGGGGNSRIYRFICLDGDCFAAKFCTDATRLTKEFTSLRFLVGNGFHDVPLPIAVSFDQHCAIYRFIDGKAVEISDVGTGDIDCAVGFLGRLNALAKRPESCEILNASEACFSIYEVIDNIQDRLEHLNGVPGSSIAHDAFRTFLAEKFESAISEICEWVCNQATSWRISLEDKLSFNWRTLSPSDFGFHNALWHKDGTLVFLDFEHFGWDDPAKLISDFLLHPHPLMAMPERLKRRFVTKTSEIFSSDEILKYRLELVFPLFALKWCTILLNEFIPKDLNRRMFAEVSAKDRDTVLNRQLIKARQMLVGILKIYRHFPYRDCIYGN